MTMTEYISREAALEEQKLYNTYASAEMAVPVDALREIPAADVVEVRHGFWRPGYKVQNCSICSYRGKSSYKFCPLCGAKMDGRQNA